MVQTNKLNPEKINTRSRNSETILIKNRKTESGLIKSRKCENLRNYTPFKSNKPNSTKYAQKNTTKLRNWTLKLSYMVDELKDNWSSCPRAKFRGRFLPKFYIFLQIITNRKRLYRRTYLFSALLFFLSLLLSKNTFHQRWSWSLCWNFPLISIPTTEVVANNLKMSYKSWSSNCYSSLILRKV